MSMLIAHALTITCPIAHTKAIQKSMVITTENRKHYALLITVSITYDMHNKITRMHKQQSLAPHAHNNHH